MSLKKKLKSVKTRKDKYHKWYKQGEKTHKDKIDKAKGVLAKGKVIKQNLDKVKEEYEKPKKERVNLAYRKKSTNQLNAVLGHTGMEKYHKDINKYSGIAKQTDDMLQKHDRFIRQVTKGRGVHIPTFDHLTQRGLSSDYGTQGNYSVMREPWGNQIF